MNSIWLIITSIAIFSLAYRYYGAFLAAKVAVLDNSYDTPATRLKDGVDYHPTNPLVLFGHHFAAIAGAGPLIGPVLAAQWGYYPGFTWIVVGSCLAGGVHDFIILIASVRHDGKTMSRIALDLLGPYASILVAITTLFTVICVLSGTGVVVVNALSASPWATFTILMTIPAALLTGLWMYKIRPGHLGEASLVGVTIVLAGVFLGKPFADSGLAHYLAFSKPTFSIILPTYTAIASILPVWLLMCPRDYLSSYMKIGVIVILAAGLLLVHPELRMPATTPFLGGGGPVIPGAVWPFVSIVIMCGALSGFHALISSGTTPKMISKESHVKPIGYGSMLVEGFVAVCALIAACVLEPGDYFNINTPQDKPEQQVAYAEFVDSQIAKNQWDLKPQELPFLEKRTEEKLSGRVGGAVTLAVGMAKVFEKLPGMEELTAYWYHFVIMFEALFILTLIETGTRVARFIFQECLTYRKGRQEIPIDVHRPNWTMNIATSLFVSLFWGFLLYSGSMSVLWRMFGIANQLISSVAFILGTSFILSLKCRKSYALCTFLPLVYTLVTVLTAGYDSVVVWCGEFAKTIHSGASGLQVFYLGTICALSITMIAVTLLLLLDAGPKWLKALKRQ